MPSSPRAARAPGLPLVALALWLLTPACGAPGPLVPASPSSAGERGPPGTLKVKFLPPRPGEEWQIVVGNRALCAAPCERWVDPELPYAFKYDPGPLRRNEFIDIPDLRPYASLERVSVRVEGRSTAEFVGGIVATSFGGLGVVTGATLAAVGAALGSGKGGSGLYTAGVITLPASAVVLAGGIYWIVDSRGEVHIEPAAVGPGGLSDPDRR
jgi:hypothetical protein